MNNGCVVLSASSERALRPATIMEASTADHLLIKSVDDITESWVRELLLHRCDLPDPKPPVLVKSWVKGKCPSGDPLAGFSSMRATVQVAYEVEGEGGTLRKETFVVKLIPTLGFMSELLVSEGMHHNEVGQYKYFLRSLAAWEAERRGVSCGVLCEMIPPHSLAVSCDQHFTLVLPELRELGYTATNMPTGLDEDQIMVVVKNIGCFHGSVVAFKTITGVNLEEAFPKCFLQTSPDSPLFSTFTQAGFDKLKEEWAGDPSRPSALTRREAAAEMLSWKVWSFLLVAGVLGTTTAAAKRPPNIVVMLADDLGIGDVGCYGNTTIRTPNIDKLASQGMKLTHHLAAAAMCTPSRAALLTARYPSRYGLVGSDGWGSPVIAHVASHAHLPLDEVTLATALSRVNYTTALVGKWHLGSFCNFLGRSCPGPLNHGFQTFFGIPVTLFFEFRGPHAFWKFDLEKPEYQRLLGTWVVAMVSLALGRKYFSWRLRSLFLLLVLIDALFFVYWFTVAHVGINDECLWGVSPWLQRMANSLLMRQDQVVEQPIQLDGLSQRLVQESRKFLEEHANDEQPFFLFHSFGHAHTPMYSAPHMKGVSKHGEYGDNVEEMDEGVGALMAALKELGLEDNTIVYFTSDQGAHLEALDLEGRRIGGYNGRFKGGKVMGGAEGGIRVAGIYRYPGHIPAGKTLDTPTSLMDLMPTVLDLAGLPTMQDIMAKSHALKPRQDLDGESIADLLQGKSRPASHPPRIFLHHCRKNVHAVRLVTDKHIYKMYLFKHKWHPGSTQCGWGHSVGCHCHPTWMHDLTKQPELYDLKVDPYEDKEPISPDTKEYKEVVGHLQKYLEEWHRNVHYPTPQLTSLFEVAWTPWMQPFCLSC